MSDAAGSRITLHHAGYVVAAIAPAIQGFADSLGATWDGQIFADPNQRVKVAFLQTREGDPQIELVEPNGPDAPVHAFLAKGGGLHHLCYEVDDIEAQLAAFKQRKALIVKRPKPAVAFDGRPIAWLLTREKLLIELLERVKLAP